MVVSYQIPRTRNDGYEGWRRGGALWCSLGNERFNPGMVEEGAI